MKTYIAVVNKDKNSAFGLWFPDVPGCFSASDDQDGIVKNAIEALNLHLEGIEAPQPRNVDEIAHDDEVAAALSAGAYLLGIPLVSKVNKLVRANISVDKGVMDAIDHAAVTRGMTRSAFIIEAAINEIEGR